jgi:hypothetical protein
MAKNKGEVVEKYLNQTEREIFHQAKVKELRSFFECSVWEFSTAEQATPENTYQQDSFEMDLQC